MSDKYSMSFNVYSSPTGHTNVTFSQSVNGVKTTETYGAQINGGYAYDLGPYLTTSNGVLDGKIKEETAKLNLDHRSYSVELTKEQFESALALAKATVGTDFDYNLFGYNCVSYAQELYAAAGLMGHFAEGFTYEDYLATKSPVWAAMPAINKIKIDVVKGKYFLGMVLTQPHLFETPKPHRCFVKGTAISVLGGVVSIESIRLGDLVRAYDDVGIFTDCRVTQLFRNVTTEFLILSCGLTVTPGHRFLNEFGQFEVIENLVKRGGCIVREDGTMQKVTAERVVYSDATRHLYEEAEEIVYATAGSAAIKPEPRRGWRTYNFEVEHLHTYVAGGVRVHNDSLQNFLNLSVMMKNDAYTAVAVDGLVKEFGWDAVGSAAWAGEPISQASYADHVKDMMDAYNEALAAGDFKTAEGIIGGLQEAQRGAGWAMDHSLDAIAQNPTSSAVRGFQDNYNAARASWDALEKELSGVGASLGGGGSPGGTPSGSPPGGMADPNGGALSEPSGGANHSAGNRPGTANPDAQPVSTTVGTTTITRMPNGTIYSQVNSGKKQSFAQVRGKDVLALGEMETLKDGTKRETYTSTLVSGGMQTTVIRYAKDGTVLSQTIKVNEVLRLKSATLHDGTKTLDEYTAGGLLKSQIYLEPDQSGWSWEKNFKPKVGEWKTKKTYFNTKNVTTHEELTYQDGRKEVKAYVGDHMLITGFSTLTLLKEARHGTGNNLNNLITGNSLDNRLHGDSGQDTLYGGIGDDTLDGASGTDSLFGGEGHDNLSGGEDNDSLFGEGGSDLLWGGNGQDTLMSGQGHDELHGGTGNDRLEGEAGNDLLFGDDGDDHLEGGEGHDELQGGAGNDTLSGGADRDWLVGGTGLDSLYGRAGDDRLIGGDGDDRLLGGDDQDTLEGGIGDDTLDGEAGNDQLRGEAGDDVLSGGDGRDDLDGGDDHDLLSGGSGNDALLGEAGNDTLRGGEGDDALVGHDGEDLLYGNEGDDLLKGNEGIDQLYGEAGADYLSGGGGNDILLAGDQDDQAYGDDGDDTIDGESGSDKLWGGSGNDTLLGGLGHDVLTGDAGHDSLNGGVGDDKLSGGLGNDSLDGGGGSDQLFGNEGNDILIGGPDVDYIDGGSGTDTIVLTGQHLDYLIRFSTALGRFSIVDQRSGSPDGTDLADIELFRFADGDLTVAQLNYMTETDADIAYNVDSSDGSKSRIGWRPSAENPTQIEAFIQRRTIAGTLMSETVFKADGTRTAQAWDVSPDGRGETWQSYIQTFDANAELLSQVYKNDNGSFTLWQGDPYDVENWHDRETTYNSQADYDLGLASKQFDIIDEGELGVVDFIRRQWDRGGADWNTIVEELDEAERTLIETTVKDTGSTITRGRDYSQDGYNYRDGVNAEQLPGQEWIAFEERRDAATNKFLEIYKYYGATPEQERTVERGWDFSGEAWTRYELTKDYLLKETQQETWFDNGTHSVKIWNWSGQGWEWFETLYNGSTRLTEWEQYAGQAHIYREFNGGAAFDERETRTNVNGTMTYQHVKVGNQMTVHLWDVAGQYTWVEQITTTVNGTISRIETIYSDHKTIEIRDLTGNQEWTKHIQEWRGRNFQNKVEDKFYDDNSLTKKLTWDFNGENWDSTEKRYDNGNVIYDKIVYDADDYTIVKQKDTGNADWDWKTTKSRKYGSVMKTFAVFTTFDQVMNESNIMFNERVVLTDHGGYEFWYVMNIHALNNSPTYGYAVFEGGGGLEVGFLPGYLDRARVWEGTGLVY